VSPSTLTIVTPVRVAEAGDGRLRGAGEGRLRAHALGGASRLRAALGVVQESAEDPSSLAHTFAFHRVKGLHFARFAIVPESETSLLFGPKKYLPAALVLSLVFDGTKVECVEQLIAVARNELDIVYASCEGYPGPKADAAQVREYFFAHDIAPFVFYCGAPGLTVAAVENTAKLREKLRIRLDALLRHGTAETPESLCRELRPRPPEIASRELPPLAPSLSEYALRLRVLAWIGVVASPFAAMMAIAYFAAALLGASSDLAFAAALLPLVFLAGVVLLVETADARRAAREGSSPARDFSNVRLVEDLAVQNALSHCVVVKSGVVRFLALRFVFWAIEQRVHLVDRHTGALGGIASIHFARWVPLDGGDRLLFLSDYDGSWESYLAEFVDRAAKGLTSIWSNTVGFPETRLLVFRGARDVERFKRWTRDQQIETPIWYSAYPERTIANIQNDLRVAQLLSTEKPPRDETSWLRLL
jgi:hypothetical protein